jgi:hypothetical protein
METVRRDSYVFVQVVRPPILNFVESSDDDDRSGDE